MMQATMRSGRVIERRGLDEALVFEEETLGEAMAAVRERLGPDALILGVEASPGGRRVRVRARTGETAPRQGPTTGSPRRTAARRCAAFVGPAGAGKTTTIAKLAGHLASERRLPVRLHTLDDFRLGGAAQLMAYAELLGLDFGAGDLGLAATASPILIDTPGVMPGEQPRVEALARRIELIAPEEIHLVLPGTADLRLAARVRQALAPLGANRLVVTQVDEPWVRARVAQLAREVGLPVSYLGIGPEVPADLVGRYPGEVSRYLEYGEHGVDGEIDAESSARAA